MRSILGVFAVAWLNLVMQPCAMALGNMEEHDCPRCPPSQEEGPVNHALHDGHMAALESAASEMPCSVAATDCNLLDELNHDGRTVKLKLNDAPNLSPLASGPPVANEAALKPAEHPGWHSTRSPPPSATVPLNVVHCVYLK